MVESQKVKDLVTVITDQAPLSGDGSAWNDTTIALAAETGTLCASMDTGLVYWSENHWNHAPTAVRERPASWVYVPDEIVTRINPNAAGLTPGEYVQWDAPRRTTGADGARFAAES